MSSFDRYLLNGVQFQASTPKQFFRGNLPPFCQDGSYYRISQNCIFRNYVNDGRFNFEAVNYLGTRNENLNL